MNPILLFPFVFLLIATVIVVAVAKGLAEWVSNNGQLVLTSRARVGTKRTWVSGGSGDFPIHTSYYATFDLENGERREVRVGGSEYGQLAEGDQGEFTYQGTRYKGFVRTS